MLISVTALLSVVHPGVCKVSWENWDPLGMYILPSSYQRGIMLAPFWITSDSPLIVCDYDIDYDPLQQRWLANTGVEWIRLPYRERHITQTG